MEFHSGKIYLIMSGVPYTLSVLRIFVHCRFLSSSCQKSCIVNLFVKLRCSVLKCCHLTSFFFFHESNGNLYIQFSNRSQANPGKVSMDSDSLRKTLKSMLNTLPRILAPLIAINCFPKKNHKIVL